MKFNKILHPEILFGKRGDKELVKSYDSCLRQMRVTHVDNAYDVEPTSDIENELGKSRYNAISIMKLFKHFNGSCYHIQKDFLLALSDTTIDVPTSLLPEEFFAYISFPPQTINDGTYDIEGAYVAIFNTKENEGGKCVNQKYICVTALDSESSAGLGMASGFSFFAYPLSGEGIKSLFEQYLKKDTQTKIKDQGLKLIRTTVNAICYIHSQQPELERKPSHLYKSNRQRALLSKQNEIVNECTLPVTFINWRWKRRPIYQVGSTTVTGHFRWQACGPGMLQRKFIYVEEHIRTFENVLAV